MINQFLFLSFSVFLFCSSSGQSPWVPGKGKGYAQIGFTSIGPYATLFLNGNQSYELSREITDRTLQLYGEYGLTEKSGLMSVFPIKISTTGPMTGSTTPTTSMGSFVTLGNIQFVWRQNLINQNFILSGQLAMEIPTSGYDIATGLRGGLDAFTFAPSLSIGGSISKVYGFLSTGIGIRTNNYSSDIRIAGEIGYEVIKRNYLILVLDWVENFENSDVVHDITHSESGLYLNNQSYFAYGLKAIIGITEHIGLTGAFYGAGGGNLVAKAPSLNIGVYYKW